MGRTRTRGAAVSKEGRGGGRLTAYKCVRMCVCQVARCGGAPCVYPAEGTAVVVGRCNRSISRVHALCSSSVLRFRAENFRANWLSTIFWWETLHGRGYVGLRTPKNEFILTF